MPITLIKPLAYRRKKTHESGRALVKVLEQERKGKVTGGRGNDQNLYETERKNLRRKFQTNHALNLW